VKARGSSTSGSEYSSTCTHGSCFLTPPWPPAELLPGLRVDRPISQRRNGSCSCCAAAAPLPPPVGVRQNHVATAGASIDMVSSATDAEARPTDAGAPGAAADAAALAAAAGGLRGARTPASPGKAAARSRFLPVATMLPFGLGLRARKGGKVRQCSAG